LGKLKCSCSEENTEDVVAEVVNLSFSYEDKPDKLALRDINLKFRKGRFYLVAGASGSGKSTLLKCIVGLIPHMYSGFYSGDVIVAGHKVKDTPIKILARHVGFVFQNPENQIFMFSVEKDVAFGLENLGFEVGEIRGRVEWALEILGLKELRDKPPYELSDGQKQRVAIAGVLALRPQILILDEPTSLLDPKTAYELVTAINKLRALLGLTVIIVEHRLELLLPLVDEVIVLKDGRVVLEGNPRFLFRDYSMVALAKKARVLLPPVVEVYHQLLREGVKLNKMPLTSSELVEELGLASSNR
jgi:energy-coupling factor transporter ATP-binding protein EcfA2